MSTPVSTPGLASSAGMPQAEAPAASGLAHLGPAWFAPVMGLSGLALAWHRATTPLGPWADAVAAALALFATACFGALLLATAWRWRRHAAQWAEDRRHPVRHAFVATLPASTILVATAGVALGLPAGWMRPLWWLGAAGQLVVTAWVLGRWWQPAERGGLPWAAATPGLFIPIVGNVLVPLAGVALGQGEWAAAQFGVGLLFWPVITALLVVRLAVAGPWPERLRPVTAIFVAPPAVVGLSALQLGAPPLLAWLCWGMAAFSAVWVAVQWRALVALPFGMSHWALSFPMAALSTLTLTLAPSGPVMSALGLALLAGVTVLIGLLVVATLRGLQAGRLLVPEPVSR